MLGNCHLNRPTDEYLMKAGDWDKVDFLKYKDEKDFAVIPHIYGRLTKPKQQHQDLHFRSAVYD